MSSIEIKAFGINHAEMHMRRGEWAEAAKVIGSECVGLVKSCPGGEFPIGAKVAALMGGLGRTINGSVVGPVATSRRSPTPAAGNTEIARLQAAPIRFTFFWPEVERWKGRDFAIAMDKPG